MPYFHSRVIRHDSPDKAPRVSSLSTIAHLKHKETFICSVMAEGYLEDLLKCIY